MTTLCATVTLLVGTMATSVATLSRYHDYTVCNCYSVSWYHGNASGHVVMTTLCATVALLVGTMATSVAMLS